MSKLVWVVLILLAVIVYLLVLLTNRLSVPIGHGSEVALTSYARQPQLQQPQQQHQYLRPGVQYHLEQSPPNMPSVRISEAEEKKISKSRRIYGGVGDKPHLGGFTKYDPDGVSPNAFNYMIGYLAVKSFIDVGCGKGFSTRYFMRAGADVLCVEGSHDAVSQTLLPLERVVEHDFTRGQWWPNRTYDAAWAVEFLEHVGRQYMHNYMPIFHKAALIFVTASRWGGWHHVEVKDQRWWITRFEAQGFVFSSGLTHDIRMYSRKGRNMNSTKVMGSHISNSMMVFINPTVASRPEHQHIMGGHGCFHPGKSSYDNFGNTGVPCKGVDALPPQYEALLDCRLDESSIWNCNKNISLF